jgi:hypothetical protein
MGTVVPDIERKISKLALCNEHDWFPARSCEPDLLHYVGVEAREVRNNHPRQPDGVVDLLENDSRLRGVVCALAAKPGRIGGRPDRHSIDWNKFGGERHQGKAQVQPARLVRMCAPI